MRKCLGKIDSARFGIGGYQDAMIGFHVQMSFDGSGVYDSKCAWDCVLIKHTENCKWTEEGRNEEYSDIVRFISKILNDAKVYDVSKLAGTPIEITLNGNQLESWRVLTEVI